MTEKLPSARWVEELRRQLGRGKHVILHGNVRDKALIDGRFERFLVAVDQVLKKHFVVRPRYNCVEGVIVPEGMKKQYDAIVPRRRTLPPRGFPVVNRPGAPDAPTERIGPEEAALAIDEFRALLASTARACAVVEYSDKLTGAAEHQDREERELLVKLELAAVNAHRHEEEGITNALVLVAPALGQIPNWLYRGNPLFHVIPVDLPDRGERALFLSNFYSLFNGSSGGDPDPRLVEEFAALTVGLTFQELQALETTSHRENKPITRCRELIEYFKYGIKDDPWQRLNAERIEQEYRALHAESEGALGTGDEQPAAGPSGNPGKGQRYDALVNRVIGQPQAVRSVLDVLVSARGGVGIEPAGRATRPRGALFFVGPTGVGKTELAKAVSALVFFDENAFARFDMSEYNQEGSVLRLTGAPPSYVGHEAGGQLTNLVKARPFTVLLFDEIDKAHPSILDTFLQIIDEGRLTDGLGETVDFSQTLIIFTSNQGADQIPASGIEGNYEDVRKHFVDAVQEDFKSRLGRPELLGRIGKENIVAFDYLQPRFIPRIVNKFLHGVAASAARRHDVQVTFDPSVMNAAVRHATQPEEISLGARSIRTFIEKTVLVAINQALLRERPEGVRLRLDVRIGDEGRASVTSLARSNA